MGRSLWCGPSDRLRSGLSVSGANLASEEQHEDVSCRAGSANTLSEDEATRPEVFEPTRNSKVSVLDLFLSPLYSDIPLGRGVPP